MTPGKTLRATLTPNSTSDYDLTLYNAAGTQLSSSTLGTGQVDTATAANNSAAAITIYVRVLRYSGGTGNTSGRYTLRLEQ